MNTNTIIATAILAVVILCQIIPVWRSRLYVDAEGNRLKTPYLIILLLCTLLILQHNGFVAVKTFFSKRNNAHTMSAEIPKNDIVSNSHEVIGVWQYYLPNYQEFADVVPFASYKYREFANQGALYHRITVTFEEQKKFTGKPVYTYTWNEAINLKGIANYTLDLKNDGFSVFRHNTTYTPLLISKNVLELNGRKYKKVPC